MGFHPYLMFGGNCREAFTKYKEVFGGELTLLAFSDTPPGADGPPITPETADMIMHAALVIGSGESLLMGSDDPTTDSFGPVQGIFVQVDAPDAGEAKRMFDALSEGGRTLMPLAETFWTPAFGMCIDRFGTPWMVSAVHPAE